MQRGLSPRLWHSLVHLQGSRHMNHPEGGRARSQDREERGKITHQLTAPRGTRPRAPRGAGGVLAHRARGWVHRSRHHIGRTGGCGGQPELEGVSALARVAAFDSLLRGSCRHFLGGGLMGTEPSWDTIK